MNGTCPNTEVKHLFPWWWETVDEWTTQRIHVWYITYIYYKMSGITTWNIPFETSRSKIMVQIILRSSAGNFRRPNPPRTHKTRTLLTNPPGKDRWPAGQTQLPCGETHHFRKPPCSLLVSPWPSHPSPSFPWESGNFRTIRAAKLMASATRLQISAMRRLPTQTMRENAKV